MKRIAIVTLLGLLSLASSLPAQAQRISPQENARRSRNEIKQHEKMLNKANKKQRKAQRRAEKRSLKAQRKATRKANRRTHV